MASERAFKADVRNNQLSDELESLPWEYIKLRWIEEHFPDLFSKLQQWADTFRIPIYCVWVLMRMCVQWSNGFACVQHPDSLDLKRRNSLLGLYGFPGIGKTFIISVFQEVTTMAANLNIEWRRSIKHSFRPTIETPSIREPANFDEMIEGVYQRGGLGVIILEEQSMLLCIF